MAAHLERVADGVASDWVYKVHAWRGRSPEFMQAQKRRLAELLAAALAACAREARIEAIKDTIRAFENEYCNHEQPLIGVARGARAMCELKFEVERAAGESK